jgi:hypothetical protein
MYNFQLSTTSTFIQVSEGSNMKTQLFHSIWQIYLCLLLAIVTSLLITLIDKQSGLIFAFAILVPTHSILRNSSLPIPRTAKLSLTFAIFTLGIVVANKLGISIHGDIQPFASDNPDSWLQHLQWLKLDHKTLLAAGLLLSSAFFSKQLSFQFDLSRLTGFVLLVGLSAILFNLVWFSPSIDVPLRAIDESTSELPSFVGICLFIFAGLSIMLLHSSDAEPSEPDAKAPQHQFAILQTNSFVQFIFILVMVVCLATALGIDSWTSNHIEFNSSISIETQLMSALHNAAALLTVSSTQGSIGFTLLISALGLTGFSLLIHLQSRRQKSGNQETVSPSPLVAWINNDTLFKSLTFLLCCYLIDRGISVPFWVTLGMLAWLLVCGRIFQMTIRNLEPSPIQLTQTLLSVLLIVIGMIQTLWVCAYWAWQHHWGFSLIALVIFA